MDSTITEDYTWTFLLAGQVKMSVTIKLVSSLRRRYERAVEKESIMKGKNEE